MIEDGWRLPKSEDERRRQRKHQRARRAARRAAGRCINESNRQHETPRANPATGLPYSKCERCRITHGAKPHDG